MNNNKYSKIQQLESAIQFIRKNNQMSFDAKFRIIGYMLFGVWSVVFFTAVFQDLLSISLTQVILTLIVGIFLTWILLVCARKVSDEMEENNEKLAEIENHIDNQRNNIIQ